MHSPTPKRRKVRKGTHSCWECRRRKVACKYASNEDTTCINCQGRAAPCLSQEHDPESIPPSSSVSAGNQKAPDNVFGERLSRLEEMMGNLSRNEQRQLSSEYHFLHKDSQLDLLGESAVSNAYGITGGAGLPTPEASAHSPVETAASASSERAARYRKISKELHSLLPSKENRHILAHESPGALMAVNGFHTHAEILAGKAEPVSSLADDIFPAATCHPAIIAKRLLQYNICLQLLPQTRLATIDLGGRVPCQVMSSWVSAASDMVTSVDDLVGSLQGLECLLLQVWFLGDAGHLRKAWMASRRALGMAQLMGLGRRHPALRSVGSRFPPNPNVLWYKINCCDRYHSLTLGLPAGSRNNNFASERFDQGDNVLDKMSKQYAVLAGRISERQEIYDLNSQESYAATQAIDADMEAAASIVPDHWWNIPEINSKANKTPQDLLVDHTAIQIQMRHYILLILLHLPFIVRENSTLLRRYDYNRKTCLHAARSVLQRFLVFRKEYLVYVAGRHMDYAALIAAMTLCLGYLGVTGSKGRDADGRLVQEVLEKFRTLAAQKGDRLSQESVETIQRMMGILKGDVEEGGLALSVPFLGTVNIGQRTPDVATAALTSPDTNTFMGSGETLFDGLGGGVEGGFDFTFAPLSLSFDTSMPMPELDQSVGYLTGQSNGDTSWTPSTWFDVSDDQDDWALQGVDTSFWSMLNQCMN